MKSVMTLRGRAQTKLIWIVVLVLIGATGVWSQNREGLPGPAPEVVNLVGMRFRLIPAGSFVMGAQSDPQWGADRERPVHEVTIQSAFYLGVTEVTQSQWKTVMGDPLGKQKWFRKAPPNLPVYRATWDHAFNFAKRLSALDPKFNYRVPTEAEWEYACRADTDTRFYWGDDRNEHGCDSYMWFNRNAKRAQPVALKKPNTWGLFDMSGNVWEWCSDWYAPYTAGAVTDPTGPISGEYHVLRGGSWNNPLRYCRSAMRINGNPSVPDHQDYIDLGFRVVATPTPRVE